MPKAFKELPFYTRSDMTPYLLHLTKTRTLGENEVKAYANLKKILREGKLNGSNASGYIKGSNPATCFMDVPFASLKEIITEDNQIRYEPYGIFIKKEYIYKNGARPVLYLSDEELFQLNIPREEYWRVVKFENTNNGWISWVHEREWRCKGDFTLPENFLGIVVKTPQEAVELQYEINSGIYKVKSAVVLPLSVVCQGLNY